MSQISGTTPSAPPPERETETAPAAQRWQHACALAGEVDVGSIKALIAYLADEHPFVRWQAGVSLANTAARLRGRARVGSPVWNRQDPELSYSTLLLQLSRGLHDEVSERRAATADTLGLWEDDAVVPFLIEALGDSDPSVRCSAATALGRVRDKAAVEALIGGLRDGVAWVRRAAADALGAIAEPAALPALQEALDDPEPLVRAGVVCAIGHLPTARAREQLAACTRDADPAVRWYAARGLGRIGSSASLPALHTLQGDETTLFGQTTAQVASEATNTILARERGMRHRLHRALHGLIRRLRRR